MSCARHCRAAGLYPRCRGDGGHREENSGGALRDHRCGAFHADDVAQGAARVADGFLENGLEARNMKIKANGISFHCEIGGREGAPWLVFSNSLMTNLSMWDDQGGA